MNFLKTPWLSFKEAGVIVIVELSFFYNFLTGELDLLVSPISISLFSERSCSGQELNLETNLGTLSLDYALVKTFKGRSSSSLSESDKVS